MALRSYRRGSFGPFPFGKACRWIAGFALLVAVTVPWLSRGSVEARLAVDDYAIIGEAFYAADMEEWPRAFRLMERIDDPLGLKLFRWLALVEDKAGATFNDLATFIIENPTWPRIDDLQTMAEGRLTDSADQSLTRQLFADREPLTIRGRIRFAEALFAANEDEKAARQVKRAWTLGEFSAKEERAFLKRHQRHLNRDDHSVRLDNLLWDRQWRSAERMLSKVSSERQKLAKARLALQKRAPGVDAAVEAVPAILAKDPGLLYDRIRWRRHKQKHAGAVELLLDPPEQLARPERWWFERSFQVRRAITDRQFEKAYRLASQHGQLTGGDYAEAEWLSGWLTLRFINRPKTAFRHFVRLYDRVVAPVRQARAAYWAGRAAASQNDDAGATAWYRRAASHHAAYYGQLALIELDGDAEIKPPPEATAAERAAFEASELAQAARMLIAAGAVNHLDAFLGELSATAETAAEIGIIAEYADAAGRPTLLARLGRTAAFEGKVHEQVAFPIPKIEGLLQPAAASVEPPLLLGLARQESMFQSGAASSAGARGLLQLLPSTARIVARRVGKTYDADRLVSDPDYNAFLGGHYLELLLEQFDGEFALALAGYNAGPLRVRKWLKRNGDPRKGDRYAIIDWIELIPFAETRNYVQRVLEGYRVYKRRLAEAEIKMIDYPGINLLHPPPVPAPRPSDLPTGIVASDGEQAAAAAVHRPRFKPLDRPSRPTDVAGQPAVARSALAVGNDAASGSTSSIVHSFDDQHSRDIAAEERGGSRSAARSPEEVPKL